MRKLLKFCPLGDKSTAMPAPRRIPPVRPSPGSGEESGGSSASNKRDGEPLGKILLQAKAVTREALDAALVSQRKTFLPIGRILRDEANLSADALAAALRKQQNVSRVYLRFFPVQKEAVTLLEADFCRQHEAIAFEKLGKLLCVALSNPTQRNVIKHIETQTGLEIKVFQAPWEDIQKKLGTAKV
jgi:type IV pilus assembly protein PilB